MNRELVTGIAAYGTNNASTRARLTAWLERLVPNSSELRLWASLPSNAPAAALRHPLRIAHAECEVRQWSRSARFGGTRIIQREASPFSRGGLEERILRGAERGVVDFDDAITLEPAEPAGPFQRAFPRHVRARRSARAADAVIAGNQFVADLASEYCNEVAVIPTCVDLADYEQKHSYSIGGSPVLGWIGTRSTEKYLVDIADELGAACRETGAVVEILSETTGEPPEAMRSFARRVRWSAEEQRRRLATWDVGLMPLRDTPWERGKCAYKLLQYGAAGLPAIAAPVGVNSGIVHSAQIPSPQTTQWTDAVIELIRASEDVRRASARRLREVVQDGYTYQVWAPTMRQLLRVV